MNKKIHVLSERNMRIYFGFQLPSLTGLMLRTASLSLLIMSMMPDPSQAKARAFWVGVIQATNLIPGIFLSVFIGFFLDFYSKQRILQVTAFLGVVQAIGYAYLVLIHPDHRLIPIGWVLAISIFGGFTSAVDGLGRNAIVKDAVVNRHNDAIAGIMFTSLYAVALIVGNGLAGYLVTSIGFVNTFLLNGASFFLLIFGLQMMDFSHVDRTKKSLKGMWKKIIDGGGYTFNEAGLRLCLILAVIIMLFGYTYNVILPIVAKEMFAGGPKEYSYLAGIAGVGSLVGSLSAIFWSVKRPVMFIVIGCFVIGIAHMFFACTTNIHKGAILMFFVGLGFMASFVPIRGAMMKITDKSHVGIVFGFFFTFFYGGMAISAYSSGYLVGHFGSPAVLMACGIALIVTALLVPFLPGIEELKYKEKKA